MLLWGGHKLCLDLLTDMLLYTNTNMFLNVRIQGISKEFWENERRSFACFLQTAGVVTNNNFNKLHDMFTVLS